MIHMSRILHKNIRKGSGGWIFLFVVILVYGVTALADTDLTLRSVSAFVRMLEQVLPVLVIVFILIFLLNLLLEPEWVKRYLGRESGIKGWLSVVISGILSVGPVYPWYALLRELRTKGMRTSLVAAFLYSRSIKLPVLPMLIHYFGLAYTLALTAYLIVFSVITGLIMGKLVNDY